MSRRPSKGEDIAAIILLLIGLIASVWAWTSAPCSLWSLARAGDMPSRCLDTK
ncbi:hypothetical protein [Streptomyces pseudovenezuelae]|uniref:hypothetical protein n=1 Tax=Streptomyces pseudovenezuelae TaxID=67350 RepID=UPI002E30FC23|nr:hypothetical protein [Streptomyces pseudovenezuelae]